MLQRRMKRRGGGEEGVGGGGLKRKRSRGRSDREAGETQATVRQPHHTALCSHTLPCTLPHLLYSSGGVDSASGLGQDVFLELLAGAVSGGARR